jgi:DNA-binding SARP family transcriptional activator
MATGSEISAVFSAAARARNSLRQAFFTIRHAVERHGSSPFRVDNDSGWMRRGEVISDIQILIEGTNADRLPPLLDIFEGEFLEGLSFNDETLEAWLRIERNRHHNLLVDFLTNVADCLEKSGDTEPALRAARCLLRHDPYHEPSHRVILRHHLARGERGRAIGYYETLRTLFEFVLGVSPDAETRQLVDRIRGKSDPPLRAHLANKKPRVVILPIVSLPNYSEDIADSLTWELIGELGHFSPTAADVMSLIVPQRDGTAMARMRAELEAKELLIREQAAALAHSRKIFDRSSVAAKIGVWECTLPDETLQWTDVVYDIFDLPRGSPLDRGQIVKYYSEDSVKELHMRRSRAIDERSGFTMDAEITTAKGNRRWMRLTATVECDEDVPVRIFGMKQDITEQKILLDRTRYLAEFDLMTGLANRSQFQSRLSDLCERHAGPNPSGALLVDLDGFKKVNDTLGHAAARGGISLVLELSDIDIGFPRSFDKGISGFGCGDLVVERVKTRLAGSCELPAAFDRPIVQQEFCSFID